MKRTPALLATLATISLPCLAQSPGETNEGARITAAPTLELPNRYRLSWWGISGKGYFIEQSTNLTTWVYYPMVVFGTGDVAELFFVTTARPYFLRLQRIDQPLTFDSDSDTIPDWWEITYSLNPHLASDAAAISAAGELTNLQKFQLGLNPTKLDTDDDGFKDSEEIANGTDGARPGPAVVLTTPPGATLANQ